MASYCDLALPSGYCPASLATHPVLASALPHPVVPLASSFWASQPISWRTVIISKVGCLKNGRRQGLGGVSNGLPPVTATVIDGVPVGVDNDHAVLHAGDL